MLFLSLLIGMLAGVSAPALVNESVSAAPLGANANHIVISEFRTRGTGGGNDEFIELHNPTSSPIDISNWQIWGSNGNVIPSTSNRKTISAGTIISPGGYYLITHTGSTYVLIADTTYGTGITD
ncbi:MAG: lamin tail domain-containing protein, partial [Anaerolineales bacterium]|nr:lamin tail domain-containing protein [Anaerolineales bacterium]